jgi:gamma-glutamyl phosphate reductase
MRRGRYENFDPTKLLPGEWAVVLSGDPNTANGQALYHCFAAGSVKRIATIEDAATIIANATEDIRDELTQDIASALAQVGAATNAANTATANANTATSAANAATQAATSASERAEDAIDAMGDISELAVPLMSKDVRGGAKLGNGLEIENGKLRVIGLYVDDDGDWCQE